MKKLTSLYKLGLRGSFLLVCTFIFLSHASGQTNGGTKQKDFTSSGQAEVARGDLISGPVNFNQVKHTISILFQNAKASLGNNTGNTSEPLNATWIGAIRVPADMLGGGPALLVQQLRGAVDKDEGARIVLKLNIGGEGLLSGQTYSVEFPYGKKMAETFDREFKYQSKLKSFRTYPVTIAITVERRDPKAIAEVSVHSIDVINQQDRKPKK